MMAPETVVTVSDNNKQNNAPQREAPLAWIKLNVEYFTTIPGILKLVELVFGIICMACASPVVLGGTHWFMLVAVVSFIATIAWSIVYLLSIREALKVPFNWILSELLNTGIITVLYTIAFIVQLAIWNPPYIFFRSANLTAGAFGLFNTIAYAASTYFLYVEHKNTATASS